MSRRYKKRRRQQRGKGRKIGEIASRKATLLVEQGEHNRYSNTSYTDSCLSADDQCRLNYVITSDEILNGYIPGDPPKNYIPWDKLDERKKTGIMQKLEIIRKHHDQYTIPHEATGKTKVEQQHKKREIWEMELTKDPRHHNVEDHDSSPESYCMSWWDDRKHIFSTIQPKKSTYEYFDDSTEESEEEEDSKENYAEEQNEKKFCITDQFIENYVKITPIERKILESDSTSWNRFKTITSRLTSFETGIVRKVWSGHTYKSIDIFMKTNFSGKKTTFRMDENRGLIYSNYALDKGGRFHGVLLVGVLRGKDSFNEIAKSEEKMMELRISGYINVFPERCACEYGEIK